MKNNFLILLFLFNACWLPQWTTATQTTTRWFNDVTQITTTYSTESPTEKIETLFHFKSSILPANATAQTDTNAPNPECFLKKFFSKQRTHSYVERLLAKKKNCREFLTFKSLVSFLKKSETAFKKSTHNNQNHLIKLTYTGYGSTVKEQTTRVLVSYEKDPINSTKIRVKLTFYSPEKKIFKPFVHLLQSIVTPNSFFQDHKITAGLTGSMVGLALLASLRETQPQQPAGNGGSNPRDDDSHADEEQPNPLGVDSIEFKLLTSLRTSLLEELKTASITPVDPIKGILGHQLSFELRANESIVSFVIFRTSTNQNCSVLVVNGYPLYITYNASQDNHAITIESIKELKETEEESPKEQLFNETAQTQDDVLAVVVKLLSHAIHSDLSMHDVPETPTPETPTPEVPKQPQRRILKTVQGSESPYRAPREEAHERGFQVLHFFPCRQVGAMCGYNASENAIALKDHILANRDQYASLKECILDTKFILTNDIIEYHQVCSSASTVPLPSGYSGNLAIDKYLNYRLHGRAVPVGDNPRSILPQATGKVLLLYTQENRLLPIDKDKFKNWNLFVEMISFFRHAGITDEALKAQLVEQIENDHDEASVKINEIVSEKYKKKQIFQLFKFLQDKQSPDMIYCETTQRSVANAYKLDQKLDDGHVIIWVQLSASRAGGHWETRCIFKEDGVFYLGLIDSLTPGQSRSFDTDIATLNTLLNFQMNDADIHLAQQIKELVTGKLAAPQPRQPAPSGTTPSAIPRRAGAPGPVATPPIIPAYYNAKEPETDELQVLIDLECIPAGLENKRDHDEINAPAVARATSKESCVKALQNPNTKILFFDSKRAGLINTLTTSEIEQINSSKALLICCVDPLYFAAMGPEHNQKTNSLNRILIYANDSTKGRLLTLLKKQKKIEIASTDTNSSDFRSAMQRVITSGLSEAH